MVGKFNLSDAFYVFQGFIDAREAENLLWNVERIVSNIFIPILNSSAIAGPTVTEDLKNKVKNELLPCLRSFTSSLRVAETVWMEGVFLKDYPPEAYTIRCLEVV